MQNQVKLHAHTKHNVDVNDGGKDESLFTQTLRRHALTLGRERTQVLQINVGRKCNQTCSHCHVNAGPARTEIMRRDTMDRIIEWLSHTDIPKVDITGGAPEINPNFRHLVERIKTLKPASHIMDRCNLTILLEQGQEDLSEFLAYHQVEIIASLPCYSQTNVDSQRGGGVFEKSIHALHRLNALGYGRDESLALHLVYNPLGGTFAGAAIRAGSRLQTRIGTVFWHCL